MAEKKKPSERLRGVCVGCGREIVGIKPDLDDEFLSEGGTLTRWRVCATCRPVLKADGCLRLVPALQRVLELPQREAEALSYAVVVADRVGVDIVTLLLRVARKSDRERRKNLKVAPKDVLSAVAQHRAETEDALRAAGGVWKDVAKVSGRASSVAARQAAFRRRHPDRPKRYAHRRKPSSQ